MQKKKSNQWSKLIGTGMPFIIGDSNCRGSVRMISIESIFYCHKKIKTNMD